MPKKKWYEKNRKCFRQYSFGKKPYKVTTSVCRLEGEKRYYVWLDTPIFAERLKRFNKKEKAIKFAKNYIDKEYRKPLKRLKKKYR